MPLSEYDHELIAARVGDCATEREYGEAAYALGVERARVVKPLVWFSVGTIGLSKIEVFHAHGITGNAEYATSAELSGRFRAWINDREEFFDSMDEARTACQSHHAARVLALLVAP